MQRLAFKPAFMSWIRQQKESLLPGGVREAWHPRAASQHDCVNSGRLDAEIPGKWGWGLDIRRGFSLNDPVYCQQEGRRDERLTTQTPSVRLMYLERKSTLKSSPHLGRIVPIPPITDMLSKYPENADAHRIHVGKFTPKTIS